MYDRQVAAAGNHAAGTGVELTDVQGVVYVWISARGGTSPEGCQRRRGGRRVGLLSPRDRGFL